MSLHVGLDMVAISTIGCFTKTYAHAQAANFANLHASLGYLEDAPNITFTIIRQVMYYLRMRR